MIRKRATMLRYTYITSLVQVLPYYHITNDPLLRRSTSVLYPVSLRGHVPNGRVQNLSEY